METYTSLEEDNNSQLNEECIKNLDDATKEWDEVAEIVPTFSHEMKNCGNKSSLPPSVKDSPLISVAQLLDDFRNQDLTTQRAEAEVSFQ